MKILSVIGTRPDAIKVLPVHFALQDIGIESILCSTAQHTTMLNQVLDIFQVTPDIDLHIMQENQDLFHVTTRVLSEMKTVLDDIKPSLILVQGDTTTAAFSALAAFYKQVAVGHIEAGLRSGSLQAPYPEEMNRKFISMIGTYHFAPTSLNVANLLYEGIDRERIILTGNTVVDALHLITKKIRDGSLAIDPKLVSLVKTLKSENKKIALLTAHRRESFNGGLHNILQAAQTITNTTPNLAFIYPHHKNPNVLKAIEETKISESGTVHLFPPLSYPELVYCLLECDWVATDSGGIQEEAMSLGKPVVILREKTERIEGVWAGIAQLAGTEKDTIITHMKQIHEQKIQFLASTIYGDGQASKKIASFIGSLEAKQLSAIGLNQKPMQQQQHSYTNTNP
ncbi:UDP-N-acetylglucosamine 2-epimerase (non-hydrolyzing) [Candidatus Dependentiae bacterium]|nr:UDP-N-acetylglucosamine 2-epimerase (non-hydrolyzing) [Candidatus Dependentiae bacterium]